MSIARDLLTRIFYNRLIPTATERHEGGPMHKNSSYNRFKALAASGVPICSNA